MLSTIAETRSLAYHSRFIITSTEYACMQKTPAAEHKKTASDLSETLKQDIENLSGKCNADIPKSEALRIARKIWPQLFSVSDPLPLKIGIHKEMIDADLIPATIVKIALRYFVKQDRYLEALTEGTTRIDSKGHRVGRVTLREAVGAEIALYRKQQRKLTGNTCDNREFIGRLRVVQ